MGRITAYLQNKLLDHVLNVAEYSQTSLYFALSTDEHDPGTSITEPSGGGYEREDVTNSFVTIIQMSALYA